MCVVKNGPIAIIGIVLLSLLLSCETNKEVFVSSVSLSHATAEMLIGETLQLVANVNPANATDKTVIWASSKQSVATVSNNGLVTAISEGQATIYANVGGKMASCSVIVQEKIIAVTSVTLNKTELVLYIGQSETLVATVKPDNATDKTIVWSSSDETVSIVSSEGKVTALKEGTSTITANINNKSAVCNVAIVKDPKENAIDFADIKLKAALVTRFDTNKDGEISYREAAAVSSIEGVFEGDTSFKSFDEFQFFSGVTRVPNNMFEAWAQMESIVLPGSIVTIGESAFNNCLSLRKIEIPDGVLNIGQRAFSSCAQLKKIIIPQSVNSIGNYIFSGCGALESITLPNGLRSIGWGAFENCKSLCSIELPEQIEAIGISAFEGSGLTSITIPSSVTTVNNQAFKKCQQLSTVSFNNPKTVIESLAFMDCNRLSTVILPASIKRLEYGVFWGCYSLRTIDIPETVTELDGSVFWGCTSLKSIVLPASIVSIGGSSFYRCSNLKTVTIHSIVPPVLGGQAFYIGLYVSDGKYHYPDSILVPKESLDSYKKADGWKEYSDIIYAQQ
jgi:hypothetical protein